MELLTFVGGVLGVLEATLLVAGVTIVFVMDEGGADGTASTVNDGVKLFILWQGSPFGTVMESGAGKCSSPCGVGVVFLAYSTLAELCPFLLPELLDLVFCQLGG